MEECESPALGYKRIPPQRFFELSSPDKREESFLYFQNLYRRKIKRKKSIQTIVLSHECMYQAPENIPCLIETAKPFAKKIDFIAYARKQSSHYCSHYSQFLYFDSRLQSAVRQQFENNKLAISNFTGLEAFLSALVISEFSIVKYGRRAEYQDWTRMIQIDQALRSKGHNLNLGVLPRRDQKLSLIEDFCTRSGINDLKGLSPAKDVRVHEALPEIAVELLYQAFQGGLQIPVKKPEHLSCCRVFRKKEFRNDLLKIHDTRLINHLMNYIDCHYADGNDKLCDHFDIPRAYFKPEKLIDRKSALQYIKDVDKRRKENANERIQLKNQILCECARYFMLSESEV